MLNCQMARTSSMRVRRLLILALGAGVCASLTVHAATLSRQQADLFQRKIDVIARQGAARERVGARRTPVSETEVNSWFAYRAPGLLPAGVAEPKITIVGNGKLMGTVIVDLGAIAKQKSTGGTLDPLGYLGGRVPVTVSGVLRTEGGRGQFDLQSADISGVPVPRPVLQELLSRYSRSKDHPDGVRLDAPFELPANIQKIEVGAGQAVVVQ
jgi:hypothetical protein